MSSFDQAFDTTMGHEGGYANDPNDFGGETYRGIARRFHPGWPGWEIVDHAKTARGTLKESLAERSFQLEPLVREFYRVEFWLKVGADKIDNQEVAEELFDTAVNMGPGRAVTFLQVALNALNRQEDLYPDLVEDGDIGPNTLGALAALMRTDTPRPLMTLLNVQQGAFYLERIRSVPSQERFARGWLKRVELRRVALG